MLRPWHITTLFAVLAGFGFYSNIINRERTSYRSRNIPESLSAIECMKLRRIILQNSKSIKTRHFLQYVNDIQRCPWTENKTAFNHLKLCLESCCNASHFMLVTQENTPIGHTFNYETQQKKTIQITPEIHQMFPKVSPFNGKHLGHCAVVGNGGILRNSFCGNEIDKADFVFRFNLPPMNRSYDTGSKCDLVTANPSILTSKYGSLQGKRKPFIDMIKSYGSALILMPAFSYTMNTDICFRVLHSLEDFGVHNRVVFFHPEYLKNLSIKWKENGLKAKRLSSGFMIVNAAMELCERVTLYGFWPFPKDPEGRLVSHHYYDNISPKPGFHSMPQEFYFYIQMHTKGSLYLKIGEC
ncbi:alpha-2,8-sialyltransferase 8F-like [Spea bombifrons]|uniref:alpha-2,8-sialyltransferase 8F-like n=1 Tax=Spea bombifrons TaxID=233779 RepID=UPI00234B92BF|nr:alpha-2,8-sialyltransferase 8F-like [Spea bombifrons]